MCEESLREGFQGFCGEGGAHLQEFFITSKIWNTEHRPEAAR